MNAATTPASGLALIEAEMRRQHADALASFAGAELSAARVAKSARLTGRICIATAETAAADNDIVTFDLLDGLASIAGVFNYLGQGGFFTIVCGLLAIYWVWRRHSVRPLLPVILAFVLSYVVLTAAST